MTAFKIGGSSFYPASDVSNGKRPEAKAEAVGGTPAKGGVDSVQLRTNRLAVMPRMSSVGGQSAQHVQGETVESLLRDSSSELDGYFSRAYGFDGEPE